jgi:hypothetical protein
MVHRLTSGAPRPCDSSTALEVGEPIGRDTGDEAASDQEQTTMEDEPCHVVGSSSGH